MKTESIRLWDREDAPLLHAYWPEEKKSRAAVILFAGGAYHTRVPHEAYADWFAEKGMAAFVCDYRVYPDRFPLPLLDARRAVRLLRHRAEAYDLDPQKILVLGSSAGGHLAAMVSTYTEPIDGEGVDDIDLESPIPNGQILCYPVIHLVSQRLGGNIGSAWNLLGDRVLELGEALTPAYQVKESTPPCFVWHTAADAVVPMSNSLDYARALQEKGVPVELHVFPYGRHGLGLADDLSDPGIRHTAQWKPLLLRWLTLEGFLSDDDMNGGHENAV